MAMSKGMGGGLERPVDSSSIRNVSEAERYASALGGGLLALYGLTRRSLGGLVIASLGAGLVSRGVRGHSRIYRAAGVGTTAGLQRRDLKVKRAITILEDPHALYQRWRDVESLPRVMSHLQSVRDLGNGRSHWVVRGPRSTRVEWDAEITWQEADRRISWRTVDGSEVTHRGSVSFSEAPGGRGTEVHVVLEYEALGGPVGAAIARLYGAEPGQQIEEDLRRFKQLMECGEVATTRGQPSGKGRVLRRRDVTFTKRAVDAMAIAKGTEAVR
jgi:uncharacterized membrane protein